MGKEKEFFQTGLEPVWEILVTKIKTGSAEEMDEGAHYKKAEMAITKRDLPEGFFGPAAVAPFNPSRPSFTIDLLARFVTTASRLDVGINGFIFDLGIGYGWTTEWLVRLGYQVIGVDITRDYILAGMPRMGQYRPYLLVADVENIPIRSECVEAVLSYDAFHHLPNRQRAMQELDRILRPGGNIVLVEPGKDHEHHPQSIAVMKQHGILEKGFDRVDLSDYIQSTSLAIVGQYKSDTHLQDIFKVRKNGVFETDSLKPRSLLANIIVEPDSLSAKCGVPADVAVTISNLGDTIWLDQTPFDLGDVFLGIDLYDQSKNLVQNKFAKVALTRHVRPGQQVKLKFNLPAIYETGHYILEMDMVANGYLHFKDYAYQPVEIPITVFGKYEGNSEHTSVDRHIKPTELSFAEISVKEIITTTIGAKDDHKLIKAAWQVLSKEGAASFIRKMRSYITRTIKR